MILRTYLSLVIICLALGSCADKLICPAYQSSFIHDKETLRKKFSYFENDSIPKVYTASKTKYLIAVPESYRKRYKKMQTVQMKPVYPMLDDSITQTKQDSVSTNPLDSLMNLDSVAVAGLDSATRAKLEQAKLEQADSVYVITQDKEIRILRYNFPDSLHYDSLTGKYVKEKAHYYVDEVGYNAEQENYMWYFRKELILPDVRLSKIKETDKAKPVEAKKKSFLRKLMFWKKDKKVKSDSLNIAPVGNQPSTDSLATDSLGNPIQPTVKPKKKSIFSFLKKKPKVDPNKQPAKKEDDDDKGF